MPTTARAHGASSRTATATSRALLAGSKAQPAVGVAVTGQIDGDQRRSRARATVSQVCAFWRAAVQEHQLGLGIAPDQQAEVAPGLDLDGEARTTGGPS